jgi:hypothetical protein
VSDTDLCARCGGDCPMGQCEVYDIDQAAEEFDDDYDDEPCEHEHDEECFGPNGEWWCTHEHCMNCGGCTCPGYCDDYQTYNLRPAETGGESTKQQP